MAVDQRMQREREREREKALDRCNSCTNGGKRAVFSTHHIHTYARVYTRTDATKEGEGGIAR